MKSMSSNSGPSRDHEQRPCLCSRCLNPLPLDQACSCGGRSLLAAAPGRSCVYLGRLCLLPSSKPDASLLRSLCTGPLRFIGEEQSDAKTLVCCEHGDVSVWSWRESPLLLSVPGEEEDESSAVRRRFLYSALAQSSGLILELSPNTPLIRGLLARRSSARSLSMDERAAQLTSVPEPHAILDRVEACLRLPGFRLGRLALLAPPELATPLVMSRLESLAREVDCFTDGSKALSWLINCKYLKRIYPWKEPLPRRTLQQAEVTDLGGSLGQQWLSALHWALPGDPEGRANITKPSELIFPHVVSAKALTIKPVASQPGTDWGRFYRFRSGVISPDEAVPDWLGVGRGKKDEFEFLITLGKEKEFRNRGSIEIIAIGDRLSEGERRLAELLDRRWRAGNLPAIMLVNGNSNDELKAMVRAARPVAATFELSLEPDFSPAGFAAVTRPLATTGELISRYRLESEEA